MTATKLTQKVVDAATYKDKAISQERYVLWDSSFSGFGVRVYPSGKKAYVISYRIQRRKRLMVIGDASIFTLVQARDKARTLLVDTREQRDPLGRKQRDSAIKTFKAFAELYMERYAKKHKRSWKEDERRLQKSLIPRFGSKMLTAIHRSDIGAYHAQTGSDTPYEANRQLRLLHKMFSLAMEWGFIDEKAINPADKITYHKEKKRERFLNREELIKVFQALTTEHNLYACAAIWMYLLTGARKNELLQAKWQDVDVENHALCIPLNKSGRVHYVPLSSTALDILDQIPRVADNPYIFVGHKSGQHLVNITKPWKRVVVAAGIEHARVHDLRRTVGSWLAQSGKSLPLIGKVLNHANPSTTAIYAKLLHDNASEALEEHGSRLLAITTAPNLRTRERKNYAIAREER